MELLCAERKNNFCDHLLHITTLLIKCCNIDSISKLIYTPWRIRRYPLCNINNRQGVFAYVVYTDPELLISSSSRLMIAVAGMKPW